MFLLKIFNFNFQTFNRDNKSIFENRKLFENYARGFI